MRVLQRLHRVLIRGVQGLGSIILSLKGVDLFDRFGVNRNLILFLFSYF